MKSLNLSADVLLSDIGLEHMDVVLAERFLLPRDSLVRFGIKTPERIADISELSGMPLSRVLEILEECLELSQTIHWTGSVGDFLKSEEEWLVDMRPGVSIEEDPLHPEARVFHHGNQAAQLEIMKQKKKVLVLSTPKSHAWSAAMALRSMGINAYVL